MNTDAAPPLPTIVLADPNETTRSHTRTMLEPLFRVLEVASGARALELVRAIHPDCVLVEAELPDMSSLDLLQALGAGSQREPLAAIILAQTIDAATAVRAIKSGAHDYLSRQGLDRHRLLHAVRNAMHNVSLRRQLASHRRELDRQREWLSVTLASVGDGVITTDTDGRIATLNPIGAQMTGWGVPQALHRPVGDVVHLLDAQSHESLPDPIATVLTEHRSSFVSVDAVLQRRDGGLSAVEYSASPIRDRDARVIGAVLVFHDVSEARALALKMSRIAQHDFLTDLPNRMLLSDRMTQAIRMAQRSHSRVALLFVDLDRFKQVNDSLGHEVGDELLKMVAHRLTTVVRRSDTVSRYGGDEFVVLLPDIEHAQDAADIAAKLLSAGAEPYRIQGHDVRMSFSIGIAIHPEDGDDGGTLIRHADIAMYEAKQEGRNTFRFFDRARNIRATQRMSMERGLRSALKNGEFTLLYQPKLGLADGLVSGCEALIRWRRPEGDIGEPASFIAAAEESGLIVPIGSWALHEACRQCRRWILDGVMRLPVAVNISAVQFHGQSFVDDVTAILRDTRLPPQLLELELTETALMRDVDAAIEELRLLRAMGVRIAIDDFGTGYCGLAYLKRLPVDTLKIDQSFVRDVPEQRNDAEIVSAIVRLGRTLEREIVAEGVETEAQADFLRALRCDSVQGFLFSRPLSADALASFVAKHHAGVMMRGM